MPGAGPGNRPPPAAGQGRGTDGARCTSGTTGRSARQRASDLPATPAPAAAAPARARRSGRGGGPVPAATRFVRGGRRMRRASALCREPRCRPVPPAPCAPYCPNRWPSAARSGICSRSGSTVSPPTAEAGRGGPRTRPASARAPGRRGRAVGGRPFRQPGAARARLPASRRKGGAGRRSMTTRQAARGRSGVRRRPGARCPGGPAGAQPVRQRRVRLSVQPRTPLGPYG